MIEIMNLITDLDELINELKSDKEKLQMLNKKLSKKLIELKNK